MEKQIKISINLIVKDEQGQIENTLHSVKDIAEEIIVIDTGSTDETPKICSKYGGQLFFHKWEDDFSKARNKAIEYSDCDWIMVIDADEIANFSLSDLPIEKMKDEKVGGVNILIRNFLGDDENSPVSTHRYTRIFRNSKNIRFSGRIHEQIRESIEDKNLEIIETDLEILHFGYQDSKNEKLERNKELLLKDIEQDPDDWKLYHLAETEFSSGNKEDAYEIFKKIVDSPELSDLQEQRVKTRLGQIYLGNDKYDEAEEILNFKSQDMDSEGLRKYVLAAVYLSTGSVEKAIKLYESEEVHSSGLVDKLQLETAVNGANKYLELTKKN